MTNKPKILVIAGPTASGKSDLAIAMAQQFNGEIISADALQVYRHLDIGTAKISLVEQQMVPHHLIDILDMTASFSVAEFVRLADQIIADIVLRGKLPIIAGGTGFYVKALLGEQVLDFVASDPHEVDMLKQQPLAVLVDELKLRDEDLSQRVDLHNKQRVIRAIEISRHGQHDKPIQRPQYDACVIGIDWPREVLYQRINARAQDMIDDGILDEVRKILTAGGESLQAGKAIGYKEFFPYLQGHVSLSEAITQLQQDSRRYAKRQLTYLRHQIPGLIWVQGETAQDELTNLLKKWL